MALGPFARMGSLLCLVVALGACGGQDQDVGFAKAQVSSLDPCASGTGPLMATWCSPDVLRRRASAASGELSFAELLAWAERQYPTLFPGPPVEGDFEGYRYRHYPASGNYIGLKEGILYLLGPVSGGAIQTVGALQEFRCVAKPELCVRPESDRFAGSELDSCRWLDWSFAGGRSIPSQGLMLSTDAGQSVSVARVVSQYRLKGDAQLEVEVAVEAGLEAAIPGSSQLYASFGLSAEDNNQLFIALGKSGARNVVRALRIHPRADGTADYENAAEIALDGVNSLRLRIERRGARTLLSYRSGAGEWRLAADFASLDDDSQIALTATTVSLQRELRARFSDFELVAGTSSWRAYARKTLQTRADFIAGGNGGDAFIERSWGTRWGAVNPQAVMKASGMGWYATDMGFKRAPELAASAPAQWRQLPWQGHFWRSPEMVAEDLKGAAAAGLRLYVQLFLSEQAANASVQKPPAGWESLSVEQTAERLEAQTEQSMAYLKSRGLNVEIVSVGNEIEMGILGFRPGERLALPPAGVSTLNLSYLRSTVWPTQARLLKAAIAGVRKANPGARIVLHVAGLGAPVPADRVTKAFFRFMHEQGVPFDLAGVSHPYAEFPWRLNEYSTDCWMQRLQETSDRLAELGKPMLIAEGSYPRQGGAFAAAPMREFPYSESGQAGWVRELLRFGHHTPNVAGFLYFYPDYFIGMGDSAALLSGQLPGLFRADLSPTPALLEFASQP